MKPLIIRVFHSFPAVGVSELYLKTIKLTESLEKHHAVKMKTIADFESSV